MKIISAFVLFYLGMFLNPGQEPLELSLSNLEPGQVVQVGIYTKAEDFPITDRVTYFRVFTAGKNKQERFIISDLPYGTYAFAVYQDLNKNKKLDVNLVGYPSEPFGFSNNVRPRFSAPSFSACKFDYGPGKSSVQIKLL